MQNAETPYDFEHIRYSFQSKTIASEIYKKYESCGGFMISFDEARRQWYIDRNPHLDPDIQGRILRSESHYRHALKLGMTEQDVLAAIGPPRRVNRTVTRAGETEQWVYGGAIGRYYKHSTYFYFSGGILTAFQD